MWAEEVLDLPWAAIQQPILRLLTSTFDFGGATSGVAAFPMFEKNRFVFSKNWTVIGMPREGFLGKEGGLFQPANFQIAFIQTEEMADLVEDRGADLVAERLFIAFRHVPEVVDEEDDLWGKRVGA
jgi:hypothetical protein